MKIDRVSRKEINLDKEETTLLQDTLTLLQKISDEVNNVETNEVYLANYGIENVMEEIWDTLDEIFSVIHK